nr:hypothetical protein CFP56_40958 [Quercus suber]
MDGEEAGDKVKMMIRKDNTISVRATTLRVPGYLITNALLIWSILYGLELDTQTKTYTGGEWDFHVGVITMVLGFVLLFVEIHTLATMYLEFPTGQSQLQEKENGTQQASKLKADISI